jgi:hypothetical protein
VLLRTARRRVLQWCTVGLTIAMSFEAFVSCTPGGRTCEARNTWGCTCWLRRCASRKSARLSDTLRRLGDIVSPASKAPAHRPC